jgi:hypothetical protein
MSTIEQMAEFISLWGFVHQLQFTDQPDSIRWKWTENGSYSAKSAYSIQFSGTFCPFNANLIWKAKVEGKHRFFTWLLIQCNDICVLCDQELETTDHLCLECVFAKEVWLAVEQWTDHLVQIPNPGVGLLQWWNRTTKSQPNDRRP